MKLLFVHDHPFYKDEQNIVYSGGGLPSSIWNNYLVNFEKVIVFGRRSFKEKDRRVQSSVNGVDFFLTEYYSSPKNYFVNQKKLIKELEVLLVQVDIVLVRLPSFLGFLAAKVAKQMNKRIWVEQVGSAKEALGSHGSIIGSLSCNYFEFKNKRIVKDADFVSYVTKSKLQNDYPKKNNAVSCSVSNVFIDEILDEKDIVSQRFYGGVLKIGLIGGFDVKYKGQDVLLKAISQLNEDIKSNIHISLVGKGNYEWIIELCKELNLEKNIVFIGSLSAGENIKRELRTLGLYVQPSLTEGMPRASIEAMAMGCPVIGSNVGGIPDIVSKEFIHKKGDANKLSEDIEKMFLNRNILYQECLNSLSKVKEYSIENINRKRKEFYNEVNKIVKL